MSKRPSRRLRQRPSEVRDESRALPDRRLSLPDRRKVRGAPFNFYVVFPRDAVTVEGGVTMFEGSQHGRRYSCKACSAPLYSHYDRLDEIDLYPGSFDEPGLWQPTYELWTSRREPWLPAFPSIVRRYPESRPKWRRTEQD